MEARWCDVRVPVVAAPVDGEMKRRVTASFTLQSMSLAQRAASRSSLADCSLALDLRSDSMVACCCRMVACACAREWQPTTSKEVCACEAVGKAESERERERGEGGRGIWERWRGQERGQEREAKREKRRRVMAVCVCGEKHTYPCCCCCC